MPSIYSKFDEYISDGKNFFKVIVFLVLFICIIKLPQIVSTDIQPWDEGMYATRVLSIHVNGDFFDQSSHSVGKFYSGSHPPLLIWIGYLFTLAFGINSVSLKIVPFIFSLMSVVLIMLIANRFFNPRVAFYAALIFCSNIIFNVFSKRFQFDYPYTFFFLISFYLIILYNDTKEIKYLIYCGIMFGLCLMVKILVGFYIPLIIFISYLFMKNRINISLKDIFIVCIIGVIIALPWHVFMLQKYGSEFTDYFFKFHIYDRAVKGVEMNEKRSGALYHINYLLTIIPYSVLVFIAMFKDLKNFSYLTTGKIFLWIWFITGLLILALFKTKLEVYVLILLTPGCILISAYADALDKVKPLTKAFIMLLITLNLFWFATEAVRPEIKNFIIDSNKLILSGTAIILFSLLTYAFYLIANSISIKKLILLFILFFFISLNFYYFYNVPFWENYFHITDVKKHIESGKRRNIVYVATNYRHNPQFSFYFKGLDIGWENKDYDFRMLDTKYGLDSIKNILEKLEKSKYEIIVEKEGINRAVYNDSKLFIPDDFNLKVNSPGYELYEN